MNEYKYMREEHDTELEKRMMEEVSKELENKYHERKLKRSNHIAKSKSFHPDWNKHSSNRGR